MSKFNLLGHFDKYVSSLTAKSFTEFCERLLQKLYPKEDYEIDVLYKKLLLKITFVKKITVITLLTV